MMFLQYASLYDLYSNPDVVRIALGLLAFLLVFTGLMRNKRMQTMRGPAAIIALVIGIFVVGYLERYSFELTFFSVTLTLVVLLVFIVTFYRVLFGKRRR